MKRSSMALALTSATTLTMIAGLALTRADAAVPALSFPGDDYSVQTKTVTTAGGDRVVTYRLYHGITYVARPVDADYQSLDVSVPVMIDDVSIDATGAPILLNITVGGYMSSRNKVTSSPSASATASAVPTASTTASPAPTTSAPPGGPGGGGPGGPSNADLALAAGYVVVTPGVRGRDNVTSDGRYYGKAPAAIVDLKAAVRYIRSNRGVIPGNTDWIVSTGGSAGGALSALLGASGDSHLYDRYLKDLGAAKASDAIFASADYCPITDLEHADMAYEWMFGTTPLGSGPVDQVLSTQLAGDFARYQASLRLRGTEGFGPLSAANYDDYLVTTYLQPAAARYLGALSEPDRTAYLAANPWLSWSGGTATFAFDGFRAHVGRSKGLPAFDDFDLSRAEPILFGNETTNARHFTTFSLRYTSGDPDAQLDRDLPETINLMNPMYFLGQANPARARHWWIRVGTSDTDTSLTVVGNLATRLENLRDDVDALMYWDAGHGANQDANDFITWIGTTTGYGSR